MIVRIVHEGQFEVPEDHRAALEKLDSDLGQAVDAGDDAAYHHALSRLLEEVRGSGTPLPPEHLAPSEFVVPHEGASREEVEALLSGTQELAG
jgi:hypothetical protein